MRPALGGAHSGESATCRQCGCVVELEADVLAMIRRLDAALRGRGERGLARDEVVACLDPNCQRAEREAIYRRVTAEEREVERLLEQVRNGESVRIPQGWIQNRPGDYERVREAIAARSQRGEG